MSKFTRKRRKELLENKYVLTLAKDHIIYTEEFRKKVVLDSKKGISIYKIFTDCGFQLTDMANSTFNMNKSKWLEEFKVTTKNGEKMAERIKGAFPILTENNEIKYIKVKNGSLTKKYTTEEISKLQKNRYVEYIDENKISFTTEFKILFMKELKKGKTNFQIFRENDLDPELVGKRKVGSCARLWKHRYEKDPTFSKYNYKPITKETDKQKKQKLKEIKYLQKRVNQLEMENEFLKKVWALRKG